MKNLLDGKALTLQMYSPSKSRQGDGSNNAQQQQISRNDHLNAQPIPPQKHRINLLLIQSNFRQDGFIENSDKKTSKQQDDDEGSSQNAKQRENIMRGDSYFSLLQIVGSKHRYQRLSLIIYCAIWFLGGQLLLGTPFLFYNPSYINCPYGKTGTECDDYVCSLPVEQRGYYLRTDAEASFNGNGSTIWLHTLANEFGDYHCERRLQIQFATTLIYMGSCMGYVIVSLLNDNLGRKRSIFIALTLSFLGILLIACSQNLVMAEVGLFLAGFGIDSSINTVLYFISQTVDNQKRQKYSVIVQGCFSVGALMNILYYVIFGNWRLIFWVFFVGPSAGILIMVVWFVKETPQFLIKFEKDQNKILQKLKFIAKVNKFAEFSLEQQEAVLNHIKKLQSQYHQKLQNQKSHTQSSGSSYDNNNKSRCMTPLDLFRYKSIRLKSLLVLFISFSIYLMYYGPLMLIESYGIDNVYISSVIVISSEFFVYPILFFQINQMDRKYWSGMFFKIAIGCSFGLLLIVGGDGIWKVIEMGLVFLFRFCISFQFALFLIYCNEIFPSQLRGIAVGFSSALGTIASTLSPLIFGELQKTNFPTMVIFVVFGIGSYICVKGLPETKGNRIQEELEEFGGGGRAGAFGKQKDDNVRDNDQDGSQQMKKKDQLFESLRKHKKERKQFELNEEIQLEEWMKSSDGGDSPEKLVRDQLLETDLGDTQSQNRQKGENEARKKSEVFQIKKIQ